MTEILIYLFRFLLTTHQTYETLLPFLGSLWMHPSSNNKCAIAVTLIAIATAFGQS